MQILKFHDQVAVKIQTEIELSLQQGNVVETRRMCDELRFSANLEKRMKSAIGYAALAAMEKSSLENTALLFHYAGHSFRMAGMQSKAALVYQHSFKAGEKEVLALHLQDKSDEAGKLHLFNLRSLGRAIHCFNKSGQFKQATNAKFAYHTAELKQSTRDKEWGKLFPMTLWKISLGYSLNWHRAFLIFALGITASFFLPWAASVPVLTAGTVCLLSVVQRRLW